MKKIAILVSGNGEAAERIVKLFNEGNRVRTVLVVTDDSAFPLIERLKDEDVISLHIPDDEWSSRSEEVAQLLQENDVKLLVLDGFDKVISDEILEATEGEMLRVSSAELAPREVVSALEADLRKPREEVKIEEKKEENPTPESEWAEALKINFTPPKIPTTPPPAPEPADSVIEQQSSNFEPQPHFVHPQYHNHAHDHERKEEPMPSTWLIWSILATIFCCFIPGIIAIIFSSQVSSRYYAGDIEGSKRASRIAEIWIIVSVVLGVIAATLYVPFMIIGS